MFYLPCVLVHLSRLRGANIHTGVRASHLDSLTAQVFFSRAGGMPYPGYRASGKREAELLAAAWGRSYHCVTLSGRG